MKNNQSNEQKLVVDDTGSVLLIWVVASLNTKLMITANYVLELNNCFQMNVKSMAHDIYIFIIEIK